MQNKKLLIVLVVAALIYLLFSKKTGATSVTGLPLNIGGSNASSALAPISQPSGGSPQPPNSSTNNPPSGGFVGPCPPGTYNNGSGCDRVNNFVGSGTDPSALLGQANLGGGRACSIGVLGMDVETGTYYCVDPGGNVAWTT